MESSIVYPEACTFSFAISPVKSRQQNDPTEAVKPMACNTGIVEVARMPKTRIVVVAQTNNPYRVCARSCALPSDLLKNRA
jgi:hypothetical protein